MAWFDRLRQGLGKTRDMLTTDVRDLGRSWEMEWDDLEFALIGADTGAKIAAEVVAEAKRERERGTSFRESLEKALLDQLEPDRMRQKLRRVGFNLDVSRNLVEPRGKVVMVVGVNGVGKTTTIAKLGQYYTGRGDKVMFAAGDTFRAAATAQLEVWGGRLGIPTIAGPDGSDPGAVAFDAAQARRARGFDLLFVDTAGRLHTKHNLMEELKKVKRVIAQSRPGRTQRGLAGARRRNRAKRSGAGQKVSRGGRAYGRRRHQTRRDGQRRHLAPDCPRTKVAHQVHRCGRKSRRFATLRRRRLCAGAPRYA